MARWHAGRRAGYPHRNSQQFHFTDWYYGLETDVEVELNGQSAGTFMNISPYSVYPGQSYDNYPAQWQQFSTLFTASAFTTRLEFVGVSTFNYGLAEVSVVPAPERPLPWFDGARDRPGKLPPAGDPGIRVPLLALYDDIGHPRR